MSTKFRDDLSSGDAPLSRASGGADHPIIVDEDDLAVIGISAASAFLEGTLVASSIFAARSVGCAHFASRRMPPGLLLPGAAK